MIRPLAGGALAMSPALVITRAELDELADGLTAALDAVAPREPAELRGSR
jgi:adenosylmethionine-8-amino-7-oxononanoate aminotransferase